MILFKLSFMEIIVMFNLLKIVFFILYYFMDIKVRYLQRKQIILSI